MSNIELRPTFWASVSGGKDSLFMLYLILQNLDKYPLDGVLHCELEMDFPFIHDVMDYVEAECKKHSIPIFRIKPTKTWDELYNSTYKSTGKKWMYPTKQFRWCNSKYKLDCVRQLQSLMKAQGKKVYQYIGFCADEKKRFKYELNSRDPNVTAIYPLAEMGIMEDTILEWARHQDIYNGYYLENRRCGCMCCPLSSLPTLVYAKTHYPEQFEHYMSLAADTERERERDGQTILCVGLQTRIQHRVQAQKGG